MSTSAIKFPIEKLPVKLRCKIYEYANVRSIDNRRHKPWHRTILLAGVLYDMEALTLAAGFHDDYPTATICNILAQSGNLKALKWLLKDQNKTQGDLLERSKKRLRRTPFPWGASTCSYAVRGGHFQVLQWLHENGCPWDADTFAAAAEAWNLELLKWLYQRKCPWDARTFAYAAESGNLEMLMWLYQQECPWDVDTCTSAAEGGHLEVLQWLRDKNCPWDSNVYFHASLNGHQELLEWAINNGCPLGGAKPEWYRLNCSKIYAALHSKL